jgi:hypothetical protein
MAPISILPSTTKKIIQFKGANRMNNKVATKATVKINPQINIAKPRADIEKAINQLRQEIKT